jgi:hypothetical protein
MRKVDRLGWAAGFTLKSYGLRIGIRTNDPKGLKRIMGHLPPGWEPAPGPIVEHLYSILIGGAGPRANVRRFNLVYEDHVRLARSTDLDEVLDRFESQLRLMIAEYAPRRVFVHAGVVGWKGKAIVIPGRSFTGKSTLVSELVKAGASYYSDEYAVIDSRGRVSPFPKPLELREPSSYKQFPVDIKKLGGQIGVRPLPVGLVVLTNYREGARWRPRELSAGKGALELFANTVSARREPEKALAALKKVASGALILKGVRPEAPTAAEAIMKIVNGKNY